MTKPNEQWLMKDHTELKHKILSEYLERWLAILGRPNAEGEPRTLHYVDTHAGRGRYDGGEIGSPIIAMRKGQELHEHHHETVFLSCHNVESDGDNFASLESEVSNAAADCPSVDVTDYFGDFQEHMPRILQSIPTDQAALIFIDPFGYRDVALKEILVYLRGRRYQELFITFMSQFISRFMSDESKHETLDTVLDTEEWRALIGVRDAEEKLVDLYAKRLQQVGSDYTGRRVYCYPIKLRVPQRSPYYLIHLSQHPKGRSAMEAAVDAATTSRTIISEELPLFSSVEVEQGIIRSASTRQGKSALEIAGDVWENNRAATWRNDIRRTIQRLSQDGVLEIRDRNGQQRNAGVLPAEGDRIYTTGRQPTETLLF